MAENETKETTDGLLTPESLVPRLGDTLVLEGMITPEQLEEALAYQRELSAQKVSAPKIGQILIQKGFLTQANLDFVITKHVSRLRDALEESNRNLEQRVKLRTIQLEKALTKIEKVTEERTSFVSNISHELRTPLTHIRGYLDLLRDPDFGELNTSQSQAVNTISKATINLERLIETLITFSDIQKSEDDLVFRMLDINEVTQAIADQFADQAKERGVNFSVRLLKSPGIVNIDQQKISWVINQLLSNALKFTKKDGAIYLFLTKQNDFVTVNVTDTGIGIPKERQQEIFEPFHQLDGSATRKFGGVGLGLSLAQKILELHDSNLNLISEEGQGSSFSFELASSTEV